MKRIVFVCIAFSLLLSTKLMAQSSDTVAPPAVATHNVDTTLIGKDTTEVLVFAEVMPEFPGGQDSFTTYLQRNIVYPKSELKSGKQGTVYVSFVVKKTGTIEGVKVLKGVTGAPGLSAEAVRVIKSMPKWTPGTMNGRPVNVQLTVPITFQLTKGKKKKDKD